LPLLYSGEEAASQIVSDFETAPIPELHKLLFRWVEKFTRRSWEMTPADLDQLRAAGLADRDIVDWAQLASVQTWFTMCADGGGVSLDSFEPTGDAVGRERESYHSIGDGLLAAPLGAKPVERVPADQASAWVETDVTSDPYQRVAHWAQQRYGFVPNLLGALSLVPVPYDRHCFGLELLERPQSASLSPRQHAMVRTLVSALNRCGYSAPTAHALLLQASDDPELVKRVAGDYTLHDWEPQDRVVLDFAHKATRNAYKVVAADAQSFRDVGLDDPAYIDVLNTVAIQTSLDRLANALGVRPDTAPLLSLRDVASLA
jgi:uncharacterized peroxidase-related enzyme